MTQAYRVRGLDQALDTLKKIDPELYKAAQKRIKNDVKPMITDARKSVPQQTPLSRWKQSSGAGERSGEARLPAWTGRPANRINASVRRRKIRGTGGKRTLMKMQQSSPAGAVFDIAGRKNPGGSQFNRNLIAKYGSASRGMWPAAERHLVTVRKSIEHSVVEMERVLNAELRTRGPR
jgi:hypothetical protein